MTDLEQAQQQAQQVIEQQKEVLKSAYFRPYDPAQYPDHGLELEDAE